MKNTIIDLAAIPDYGRYFYAIDSRGNQWRSLSLDAVLRVAVAATAKLGTEIVSTGRIG